MYRSMKKGDYVRRVTHDGYVIGPYMQVQVVSGNVVYCNDIESDNPNIGYLKKNLKVIPHTSVCVSEEALMCLKSRRQSVVSHPMCKRWFDVKKIVFLYICLFYHTSPILFPIFIFLTSKKFNLSAFVTTQKLDKLIAAAPIIGFSVKPAQTNAPAATGIQITL